jgi:hypothetical protein
MKDFANIAWAKALFRLSLVWLAAFIAQTFFVDYTDTGPVTAQDPL